MSNPQPIYFDDDPGVPQCSETCPEHDGKRCRIMGQRPGRLCFPVVQAMAKKLEQRAMRSDGSLRHGAVCIDQMLTALGGHIETFINMGGQFNLRVYTNDGTAFDLHQLTGEFEGEYLQVEKLDVKSE